MKLKLGVGNGLAFSAGLVAVLPMKANDDPVVDFVSALLVPPKENTGAVAGFSSALEVAPVAPNTKPPDAGDAAVGFPKEKPPVDAAGLSSVVGAPNTGFTASVGLLALNASLPLASVGLALNWKVGAGVSFFTSVLVIENLKPPVPRGLLTLALASLFTGTPNWNGEAPAVAAGLSLDDTLSVDCPN